MHELRGRGEFKRQGVHPCPTQPRAMDGKGSHCCWSRRGLCRDNWTMFFIIISWLERELRSLIFTGGEILGISSPGFAEQEQGEGRLLPAGALVRGKLSLGVCSAFLRMWWGVGRA